MSELSRMLKKIEEHRPLRETMESIHKQRKELTKKVKKKTDEH